MKKGILLIIGLFMILNSYSQKKEQFDFELLGAVVLESNDIFSYKIEFNYNKNGFIHGYSYTDLAGENETKSYIRGYYNPKTRDIEFKESDILYTKSKHLPEDFCFISFKGRFRNSSKKKLLSGKFIGLYNDKDTCATGKVKLVSTKFVEKKVNKLYKKVKKIKKVDSLVKEELKPENYLRKFSETRINSGEKVSVFVYTNKLKMEVWDYGKEDGDKITILHNDKPILKNFTISKKIKTINIDLDNNKNVFKVITEDTGKIKTNTAKIKLYDYRRDYEVVANLEKGKPAVINVIRLKVKTKK